MAGEDPNADLELKSWYEDQVAAISSYHGEMDCLGQILDSLNPVSTENFCPTNSRISSIIWGSFSYLLMEANPEDGCSLAVDQVSFSVYPKVNSSRDIKMKTHNRSSIERNICAKSYNGYFP